MSTHHSLESARTLGVALLMLVCTGTLAADDASERARIASERVQVEAKAKAAERECAQRFAVSACTGQARAERRAALQQLDRQGALLDDAQRKRRAAERQARIEQRQKAQAIEDEQRMPPPSTRAARDEPVAETAPAGNEQAAPRRRATAASTSAAEAARRAQSSRQRAQDADAHREAVERRNREKAMRRAPEPSLPLPGASAPAR